MKTNFTRRGRDLALGALARMNFATRGAGKVGVNIIVPGIVQLAHAV